MTLSTSEGRKILGLDVGQKRIGLAISDSLGLVAQGLSVFSRSNIDRDMSELEEIVGTHKVREIVVGLPLNMDGSVGETAKMVLEFVERIKSRLGLPVKVWDERLTTLEAEVLLLEADLSRRKRRGVVDKLAAQRILQGYLDSMEKQTGV